MVKILTKEQEKDRSHFVDAETNTDLEVVVQITLLEWLAEEYTKFGCTLEFVTNKSQEGSQFCRGFGGIGGGDRLCICSCGWAHGPSQIFGLCRSLRLQVVLEHLVGSLCVLVHSYTTRVGELEAVT